MKNQVLGVFIIIGLTALPLIWFVPIAAQHDSGAAFSQFLGSGALILMAISMIISTRLPGTAVLFGPLDRAYVLHKWLGVCAMVAVLLHDTIDADIDGLGAETWLVDIGETLGELSLYGMLALVILSVMTFTPYKLWKLSHRFLGAFYVAAAIHFLLILKPFEMVDPPGVYVGLFCIAGIAAYAYATVAGLFNRGKRYTVVSALPEGDALTVVLKPLGRELKAKAGQFAFLSFDVLPEPHPFTISKLFDDGNLRFTVKGLGDSTQSMQSVVKPEMGVSVKGPYGGFTRAKGLPEIWIAAGVGVTPFIAWANQLAENTESTSTPVHMFYSVTQKSSASHLEELIEISQRGVLQLHLHETSVTGRISMGDITDKVGSDFSKASVSFCGPAAMRDQLKKEFQLAGLKSGRFHYEMFELRSGVGFRKILAWVLKRIKARSEAMDR